MNPVVERHDTHISTVLLAGDWAYKLKKPVVWPFLDFSTAAARRHFCEEELRLNRRTAPEIYVDVLPLSEPLEAFLHDPAAALARSHHETATDWVLRMRRFPAGALWSERAQAHGLTTDDALALAEHLAAFHAAQPPASLPGPDAHGVSHWVAESLKAIEHHPCRPPWLNAERFQALSQAIGRQGQALAPWLASRAEAGRVRECHGDLHLANIVQWHGRPLAFDAIEFDPDLRHIDTMNDAAFAFMDLWAHGLPRLAWRFIAAYAEGTGDWAGLRGLRFWGAYRALVRAQVALLSGSPATVFERYWRCAERLLAPPPSPWLVLMHGLSGSGKSTAAVAVLDALASRGRAVVRMRSDVERKRLHGLQAQDRGGPDLYRPAASERTYRHLLALARELLDAGVSVVVDAAFLRQAERETMRDLADAMQIRFEVLVCTAPAERMAERLRHRQAIGHDPSDATPEVLARQWQSVEALPPSWADHCHTLHNDGDLAHLLAQIDAWAERRSATS